MEDVKSGNPNSLANLSFLIEDMINHRITADDVKKFIISRVSVTVSTPPVTLLHDIKRHMHDLDSYISEAVLSILADEKVLTHLQKKQQELKRTEKQFSDDSKEVSEKMFTPNEVGKMIGMSKQGVIKGINANRIKAIKLGSRYKIPLSEVKRIKEIRGAE